MLFTRQGVTALMLCVIVIFIGTIGYVLIEDYSILEDFYMSIITITTVGFGEVRPLTGVGRGFTIVLILLGFVSLAFAGRAIAESFLETVWSGRLEIKKMKKKISELKSHYIICGFGRVGASAVDCFNEAGADFVIIESNPKSCSELKEKGYLYIDGDSTSENHLLESGIKAASGLIALLDSDPENLFIVLTAMEMNPTLHIISRAADASTGKKITRAGADSVISPFATAGRQIARDILSVTTGQLIDMEKNTDTISMPQWFSISDRAEFHGEAIGRFCTSAYRAPTTARGG